MPLHAVILDYLPFSIYWLDPNEKVILGYNQYFYNSLKLQKSTQIINKIITDFLRSDHVKVIRDLLENESLKKGYAKSQYYNRYSHDTVQLLDIQCLLVKTDNQELALLIETKANLNQLQTQRYLQEREILEIYLHNSIENIPASVYWKDRDCLILGSNKIHAKIAGLSDPKEAIGKTDHDFHWKDQAKRIIENDRLVMQTNQTMTFEEGAILQDKKYHTFLTKKAPLKDKAGNIIGIIGVSLDITERKEMEKELKQAKEAAEAADQAKTEFLNNMRHDIRTPVSGIIGTAEILQKTLQDPSQQEQNQEWLKMLSQSAEALLDWMNQILEITYLATGEIPLIRKKFNLQKTVNKIIQLHLAKAAEKNLDLTLLYDQALSFYFSGDCLRTERILLELVANAINFTHKGSVTVQIQQANPEPCLIKISVIDTGIGIPHDQQQTIYARFKRLTPTYRGLYKGTGLGLSIVKQFVDDLGGELYINSQIGQGSTFHCLLPLNKALLDTPEGAEEDENRE